MTRPHIEQTRRSLWHHIRSPNEMGKTCCADFKFQTRCGETWWPARNISCHLTIMSHTGNTALCEAGSRRLTRDTNTVSLPCWRGAGHWRLLSGQDEPHDCPPACCGVGGAVPVCDVAGWSQTSVTSTWSPVVSSGRFWPGSAEWGGTWRE